MLQDEKFGPERSEVLMGGGGFDSATLWGSDQIPKLLIPLGINTSPSDSLFMDS